MKFLLITAFTILSSQAFGQTALETLTKKIDTFLKAHVSATGGVNYVSIDKNFKGLESLVNEHKTAVNVRDLAKFSEDEKLATYINLYNIGMIYNLLKYTRAENINLATRNFYLSLIHI